MATVSKTIIRDSWHRDYLGIRDEINIETTVSDWLALVLHFQSLARFGGQFNIQEDLTAFTYVTSNDTTVIYKLISED